MTTDLRHKPSLSLTYGEGALIAVLTVIATKFCSLPSVLAGIAGSKAVWSATILTLSELAILFFALKVARRGGLTALPLPKGVRAAVLAFFALFFTMKLTAISREVATYFALSLFENVPVLPVLILLLSVTALLARKGFAAIGRMLEVLLWLFFFVLLFVLVFTRTEGDLFNALAIFSPDAKGIGEGVLKGMAWYGDGALLACADLSDEALGAGILPAPDPKAKRRITFAAAAAVLLIVVIFFAVFTSVYGEAAKMTDYAFIKLSAFKANTDELGSADWPVIILWSLLSSLHLALLCLAGETCLSGIRGERKEKGKGALPFALVVITAAIIGTLFLKEERAYAAFMTQGMNVSSLVAAGVTVAVGSYALARKKGEENEKQN